MIVEMSLPRLGAMAVVLAVAGCGGGGGGGGGGTSGASAELTAASYARLLEPPDPGPTVVSPLSLVSRDPETGGVIPESVVALDQSVDLAALPPLAFASPTVVPRDAALVLEFAADIDPNSLVQEQVTVAGTVVSEGSIQLRRDDGLGVPTRAIVLGRRVVVVPDPRPMPASPIWLKMNGKPQIPSRGFLCLRLAGDDGLRLRLKGGGAITPRADHVGESERPIEITPGNELVDFIEQNDLLPYPLAFHGYLPELAAPRIVRTHRVSGSIDTSEGDRVSSSSIVDTGSSFDPFARGGRGEWADAVVTVRPGAADEEVHQVAANTTHRIDIVGAFARVPADGDQFLLARVERFEPDPADPIEPTAFDALNPENTHNQDLRYFAWFEEVNTNGTKTDLNHDGRTRYTPFERVPSFAVLKLRFDRPMTMPGAYEAMRVVAAAGDTGPDPVGETEVDAGGTIVSWSPRHVVPSGERVHGFVVGPAGTVKTRTFAVRIVPEIGYLEGRLTSDQIAAFLKQGWRGLASVAGRTAGFPDSAFDPAEVKIEYAFDFEAEVSPNTSGQDIGAMVHLFRGIPDVVTDPHTGRPVIKYQDRAELYGHIALEFNQQTNGYLAPKAVVGLSRLLDDRNPPAGETFAKDPGPGPLTPFNGVLGARFQHLYPSGHCLPSADLAGSTLDLVRLCWSPFDASKLVSNPLDVYEDISVYAADSAIVPSFSDPDSALGSAFDRDSYFQGRCVTDQKGPHYDEQPQAVVDHARYVIDPANLIVVPGNPNRYLPWPDFREAFSWDSATSLLLEYRVRPQQTVVSFQARFATSSYQPTFPWPRFRVFSYANDPAQPLDPDSGADARALCAAGPDPGSDYGDNSRYFAAFDYVTATARVESDFIGALDTSSPDYVSVRVEPPLAELARNVEVKIEYRGGDSELGGNPTVWSPSLDVADGHPYLQLRITMSGSRATRETATIDSVVVSYQR